MLSINNIKVDISPNKDRFHVFFYIFITTMKVFSLILPIFAVWKMFFTSNNSTLHKISVP